MCGVNLMWLMLVADVLLLSFCAIVITRIAESVNHSIMLSHNWLARRLRTYLFLLISVINIISI
jgi:hypothetical protein